MSTEPHQATGLTNLLPKMTPWLCVAGAKGGVGKTMLAAVTKNFLEVESELAGWIRSICAAALAALPPMKRRQEPRKEAVRNVRLRPTVPQA